MRSKIFLVIAGVLIAALILAAVLFGLESGGFFGRGPGFGGANGMLPHSMWIIVIFVLAVALIIVLVYSRVFPDISEKKPRVDYSQSSEVEKGEVALKAVLRISNNEERRVIETLVEEGGTMLQKDIRWKTGLSRVKVHRILLRLAERGIVSAEKYYNTNKIKLADWLTNKNSNREKD